jgi:chromatin structure-remodeling complex protein RSC7
MHYPKNMQPTHARWVQIDDNEAQAQKTLTNGSTGKNHDHTMFAPIPPIVSRNYMVIDTVFESAPITNPGVPGPDGEFFDLGINGLSSVSDEVKAELPPDCLEAFEKALAAEKEWKSRWGSETQDGLRRQPRIDKGYFGFGL